MSKLKPRVPLVSKTFEDLAKEMKNRESRSRTKVEMIDGKPHRMRRGVLVEIPAEWYGHVTHKQTIRKRPSKEGQGPSFKSKAQR